MIRVRRGYLKIRVSKKLGNGEYYVKQSSVKVNIIVKLIMQIALGLQRDKNIKNR